MQVQGTDDVHAVAADALAKVRADPRVDVEQLVSPIARVKAPAAAKDPAISNCLDEAGGLGLHLGVTHHGAKAGRAGANRILPQLRAACTEL